MAGVCFFLAAPALALAIGLALDRSLQPPPAAHRETQLEQGLQDAHEAAQSALSQTPRQPPTRDPRAIRGHYSDLRAHLEDVNDLLADTRTHHHETRRDGPDEPDETHPFLDRLQPIQDDPEEPTP